MGFSADTAGGHGNFAGATICAWTPAYMAKLVSYAAGFHVLAYMLRP